MENLSLSLRPPPAENQARAPPPSPHTVMLHSVRRPPAKPSKKPEPAPPRVYKIDPRGFRRLVQRLTGSPSHRPSRPLRDTVIAPPPLDLAPRALPPPAPAHNATELVAPGLVSQLQSIGRLVENRPSPTGLTGVLSPCYMSAWSRFPLLSPGTMASIDYSPRTAL